MNAMSTSAPTPIQWIIEKKRDGQELPESDIHRIIRDYATGDLPDYQMAAFAMAVYFQGMTETETAALTVAMQRTGTTLDFSDVAAPKIDKHSTGGVGDKISLILAPLAAATGLAVPMIAGRGLGATGGTIDKLESIPGYRTDLDDSAFKKVCSNADALSSAVRNHCPPISACMPCRMYRHVPSIPLIVASILSKDVRAG